MDALYALHNRTSVPKLTDPAPDSVALQNIYRAALRAADHGVLQPWRFLLIQGDAREKLGELFAEAERDINPQVDAAALEKARSKPLRAPLILVTICSHQASDKIPEIEQIISAGAATQNMMLAAYAQGIGAMWRTGPMAYHPIVLRGLGLSAHEKIVSFLYLGTAASAGRQLPEPVIADFFQSWS
jgi:nitroreductase